MAPLVVCRKRWQLLPPQHTHLLYDRFGRDMASDFSVGDAATCERFPNLRKAAELCVTVVQARTYWLITTLIN